MALRGLAGLFVFLFLAWLMGENRRHVSWKLVAVGIITQLIVGLTLFRVPIFRELFLLLNDVVMTLKQMPPLRGEAGG